MGGQVPTSDVDGDRQEAYTIQTYMEGVTEHQSFQIVVSWLWEGYHAACRLCGQDGIIFPIWVEEAVAECAACKEGAECIFMQEVAVAGKADTETSTSAESDWSAAGTSPTESSAPEISGKRFSKIKPARNLKKATQDEMPFYRARGDRRP